MTGIDIGAIEARAAAATEGPWVWNTYRDRQPDLMGRAGDPEVYTYDTEVIEAEHSGECGCRSACELNLHVSKADAEFIAHARTDIPALLAALRERDATIARVRALVTAWSTGHQGTTQIDACALRAALDPQEGQ